MFLIFKTTDAQNIKTSLTKNFQEYILYNSISEDFEIRRGITNSTAFFWEEKLNRKADYIQDIYSVNNELNFRNLGIFSNSNLFLEFSLENKDNNVQLDITDPNFGRNAELKTFYSEFRKNMYFKSFTTGIFSNLKIEEYQYTAQNRPEKEKLQNEIFNTGIDVKTDLKKIPINFDASLSIDNKGKQSFYNSSKAKLSNKIIQWELHHDILEDRFYYIKSGEKQKERSNSINNLFKIDISDFFFKNYLSFEKNDVFTYAEDDTVSRHYEEYFLQAENNFVYSENDIYWNTFLNLGISNYKYSERTTDYQKNKGEVKQIFKFFLDDFTLLGEVNLMVDNYYYKDVLNFADNDNLTGNYYAGLEYSRKYYLLRGGFNYRTNILNYISKRYSQNNRRRNTYKLDFYTEYRGVSDSWRFSHNVFLEATYQRYEYAENRDQFYRQIGVTDSLITRFPLFSRAGFWLKYTMSEVGDLFSSNGEEYFDKLYRRHEPSAGFVLIFDIDEYFSFDSEYYFKYIVNNWEDLPQREDFYHYIDYSAVWRMFKNLEVGGNIEFKIYKGDYREINGFIQVEYNFN